MRYALLLVGRARKLYQQPLIKPGDIPIKVSIPGTSLKMLFGHACET